jgi:hypothetical protein
MYPTIEPYYTVSLLDPVVVPTHSAPSLEDQYIAERFYTHKSGKNAGRTGFAFDSKSPFPPARFQFLGHSQVAPIEDDRELAPGLRVRLLFTVFHSDAYNKPGVGLDAVLVKDQAKFIDPANTGAAETLRRLGFTVVEPTPAGAAPAIAQAPEPASWLAAQVAQAPAIAPAPAPAIAQAPAPASWLAAQVAQAPAPAANDAQAPAPAANDAPAFVASGWD